LNVAARPGNQLQLPHTTNFQAVYAGLMQLKKILLLKSRLYSVQPLGRLAFDLLYFACLSRSLPAALNVDSARAGRSLWGGFARVGLPAALSFLFALVR
jgi:hypothetical protein